MNAKTLRIPPAAPPSPAANTPTPRIPQPASAGRVLRRAGALAGNGVAGGGLPMAGVFEDMKGRHP